jgi:hypothetical protein
MRHAFPVFLALSACGGGTAETLPDESGDLGILEEPRAQSTGERVGPEIAGTQWRWVEAHCTEGPLDLASRGYQEQLRVDSDEQGLLLTYDHLTAADQCAHTIVQRAEPIPNSNEFRMIEEIRVAQPATEECMGRVEDERRGEVRKNGQFLEVLVQRSFVWCNGLEVRMVYLPDSPTALTNDQIARHYVAHFNRRDARRVAALFSEQGSLVEPFQVTHTGGASRHDGREAVRDWYLDTFAGVEWLALKLDTVAAGRDASGVVLDWSYMDPRLEAPFRGRSHFTIAAGEIFEARIELTEPPPDATTAPAAAPAAASGKGG